MPLKDITARKEYARKRYLMLREQMREQRRIYYLKNRDRFIERAKRRYVEKREEILSYHRDYSKKKFLNIAERRKRWYEENKEGIRKRLIERIEERRDVKRAWDLKNREHILRYQNGYRKRAYELFKANTKRKLAHNIRLRLRVALRLMRMPRKGSPVSLLGCTIEYLKCHIEKQFHPGMSWKNWSAKGWHIDHVKPLASFNLADPSQLAKACHYTNLQPLWAIDNIKKGSKTINKEALPCP